MTESPQDHVEQVIAAIPAGEAPVQVVGSGALADRLRERIELALSLSNAPPRVIVDTTGDLEALEGLLARVDDLGTVVLAGHPVAPDSTIDLYADVHVRGLEIVTIGPPRAGK